MTETQNRVDQPMPSLQVPAALEAAPKIIKAEGPAGDIAQKETFQLNAIHNQFAEFHEGYVSRYIALSDTKAATIFATATASIAYIFGNSELQKLLQPAFDSSFIVSFATIILLISSAFFSFLTIVPRFSTTGEGIVYFGAVASRKSAVEYIRDIASKKEADLAEARLKHCYDISKVCVRKYKSLRKSIVFGIPALFGLACMLLIK